MLAEGSTFGRYTIERSLGRGGMGQVLLAVDTQLDRHVALKIILPRDAEREEAVARFYREARLAAKITHPNTVQIYDVGEIDGTLFIAMEFIEGQSLRPYCGKMHPPIQRKVRWIADIARGLAAAHKRGLVHRDVKPTNVMVSTDDVVKVVDFGLARRREMTLDLQASFRTASGFVVGTPIYMAPEQLQGSEIDARADQFAWALTAYALLTGKNPRERDPSLSHPIPAPDGVPRDVIAILTRALERDREKRFASMDDVVSAFEARVSHPPSDEIAGPDTIVDPPQGGLREIVAKLVADGRSPLADCQVSTYPPEEKRAPDSPQRRPSWRHAIVPIHRACPVRPIRAACFASDGRAIFAFGDGGGAIHEAGWWFARPEAAHCAATCQDGSILVAADGLGARRLRYDDKEKRFLEIGVYVRPAGLGPIAFRSIDGKSESLVGSSHAGGVIAHIRNPDDARFEVVEAGAALIAAASFGDGTLVVGGANGYLAAERDGVLTPLPRLAGGNVIAMVAVGDVVFAAGAGPTLARITPDLRIEIEQTPERACTFTTLAAAGSELFVATDRGAILRRDEQGGWQRVTGGGTGDAAHFAVTAMHAQPDEIRVLRPDGSITVFRG
jgi:serine/threonine-protein kinase